MEIHYLTHAHRCGNSRDDFLGGLVVAGRVTVLDKKSGTEENMVCYVYSVRGMHMWDVCK